MLLIRIQGYALDEAYIILNAYMAPIKKASIMLTLSLYRDLRFNAYVWSRFIKHTIHKFMAIFSSKSFC